MQEDQQGNVEKNPSKINRPGQGGTPNVNPAKPPKKDEASFDSEDYSDEINPGKLDREEADFDRTGSGGSKGHEPYEFKNQPGGDRSLRKGYDESNFAVDSRAERAGEDKNTSVKKSKTGTLVGQGGYGTSGTSGTNSGGHQGYQSGLGSAGSQNGSTGYNAGSQGMDDKLIHPERPNKEVDINQLGKTNEERDKKETRH